MMNLFLIDAIGPFFRGYERRTINWSKIPFDHLKLEEGDRSARRKGRAFERISTSFVRRRQAMGVDTVFK